MVLITAKKSGLGNYACLARDVQKRLSEDDLGNSYGLCDYQDRWPLEGCMRLKQLGYCQANSYKDELPGPEEQFVHKVKMEYCPSTCWGARGGRYDRRDCQKSQDGTLIRKYAVTEDALRCLTK